MNGQAPENPSGENQGAPAFMTGAPLAIAAVALALGTFMQVLDGTIANVSLSTIAGNLGVSSDESTWVITAFAVANGATVPLTGWLMKRFGVVRTFTASVMLFTLASFLCGIAWSLNSLIVFRVMQGAVSGPMIPGSQALLIAIFPPAKRGTAMALWSLTALVGPVAGPILGGYISDNYTWNWIFLINVPVGVISGFLTWRLLRKRDTPGQRIPLDTIGVTLLVFWVGALQMALDLGKDADWFNSTMVVVLIVAAVIGFVAWVIWEMTDGSPAVNIRLFRYRNFTMGTIALSLGYAVFIANTLILPLWLQSQLGYTATWAGIASAPSGLVAVVLTPILARLGAKIDMRWMATLAFTAFGVSFAMRVNFTPDTDLWHFVLPQLVLGVGMSVFFVSLVTISLDGISDEDMPAATGISNFARITAGGFATSLVTTFWDRWETFHQSRLTETTTPFNPAFTAVISQSAQQGLGRAQASGALMRQVINQAYLLSSIDVFWFSAIACFAMVVPVWLARRPKPPSGPVAAH
jgi:DHA2 family multidrug resistance protein